MLPSDDPSKLKDLISAETYIRHYQTEDEGITISKYDQLEIN